MKLTYLFTSIVLMSFSNHALSQQFKNLAGKLVTEGNEPVANATIILKSNGTISESDKKGNFALAFNGNADTLIITHIGYASMNIPVSSSTHFPLSIALSRKENIMEEVVLNTGYQQLPKERATGAFTQIDNATLNQQVSTDIISILPAIANGLSEGRKTNQGNYSTSGQILIRGLSTINGPASPLIILDNFPYEGNIENINPNDVESITLLKDAAAASIWGARAGNGVIVITTKKGRFNQKMKVELNTNVKITGKPDLFYDKSISSSDLVNVEQFLFDQGYNFSDTLSDAHTPFSPVYEILFKQRNGIISAADANSQLNVLRNHDVRNDFDKYVYNPGAEQQYAINLKGGSDNMAWLLSGGLDKDLDVLSAGYNRLTLRSENSIKLTKRLQMNTSLYFTESKSTSGKNGYGSITTSNGGLPIYTELVNPNGSPATLAKDYRQSYVDTAGEGQLLDWNYYPLTDYKHSYSITDVQDLTGNFSLSYLIFKGLSANMEYQYERQVSTGNNINDVDSYFARNLINSFYQPDGPDNFPVPIGGILDVSNTTVTSNNIRGQLTFNKSWHNNEIDAIAGSEIKQLITDGSSYRMYGYNSDILTTTPVDLVNTYNSFVTGYGMNIPDNSGITKTNNRFVSFFGNGSYTYQKKYTVSISGRRDASNIFGVNTNDKWNPLWSAGTSWLLSNENFYHFDMFPFLKIRATYGVSGNIDPSLTAVTTLSYISTSPYTMLPFAQVDNFYNPDLSWEKNRQLNIGVDFSTIQNRVSGSIDYYIKRGVDLYGPSPLDYTAGLGILYIEKNAADMIAKGMDIELNSLNVTRKIRWTSNLNLSIYHDKVTSYYLSDTNGSDFIGDGINITGIVGKPVNSVLSYKWAGLDPQTGAPRGYLDGKVSEDYNDIIYGGTSISDLVYSGPALPTVFGSLGNTVSYKGFSLIVRFTFKFGNYFEKTSINYSTLFSSLTGSSDYSKRWKNPGDEKFTNVPSMVYPADDARDQFYNGSEAMVEKGDNIRLQYITLSYDISKERFKKLPFTNIRLYCNINDLGIIWRANKDGLDPDYTIGSIPPSKNIALGARVNF